MQRTPHRRILLIVVVLAITITLLSARSLQAAALPPNFTETLITNALTHPTAMALAPDGRIFVAQKEGSVRVIKNNALLTDPFVTITPDARGEHGLLGIALDPAFETNGFLYLYYTVPDPVNRNRILRFTAEGDVAAENSQVTIFELDLITNAGFRHDGGALHFGADGELYVATGDNYVPADSQSFSSLHGKLLRLNADGTIPTDNPYYDTLTNQYRAIWARGLRNPFTFAIQPATNLILINDVGENTTEEINEGSAGSNYGWNTCEGACVPANPALQDPIFQYGHQNPYTTSSGCSLAGGAFYNPAQVTFPAEYVGAYFFADWCGGWIRKMNLNDHSVTLFATNIPYPMDLDVGADGALYYLYYGPDYGNQPGGIYKIQSTLPPPTPTPVHGLNGAYYNHRNFTALALERVDSTIDSNFGAASPAPGVAPDTFSIRWRGSLRPPKTATYTFMLKTDGGVRLYFDGTRVIDAWDATTLATYRAKQKLSSDHTSSIKIEYRHGKGNARIHFYWKTKHLPKTIVPADVLFPIPLSH